MEKYEFAREIGSGNFGVAKLMRNKETNELVAVKLIERGQKIDQNVAREIVNHRSLRHPNIIRFREVFLTPTHLAIVMEYAAGGELFDRMMNNGVLREDEARYFFQQLICGVSYCHHMQVCHRDLKLENVLLDGSLPLPRIKICDFGYSKHSVLHSRPKSTVGTPAYIAPEVLQRKEYDGKMADVWSCGALLYTMVVGSYPFEDPKDPKNYKRMVERIAVVDYKVPDNAQLSEPGRVLLSRIFVADPARRITMQEIRRHPWFMQKLPSYLSELVQSSYYQKDRYDPSSSCQSLNEAMNIIEEAKTLPPALRSLSEWDDEDELQENSDSEAEEEEVTQDTHNLSLKEVQAHQEDEVKEFKTRQEQEVENECNSRAKEVQARWNNVARIQNHGILRIRSG